jgi:tRNA(Arg) A34 adenosine deaminase TadA
MALTHETFLRAAIEAAHRAREKGNHPFGSVLVAANGKILLEAENTVVTERDCTGHAELNLVREASQKFSKEFLAECTLYASTEPCVMCSGAIFWSSIGRVVYALSSEQFYKMIDDNRAERIFIPCGDVFAYSNKAVEIIGAMLEDEAAKVHEGFWR